MTEQTLLAVPNISEGRNHAKVDRVAGEIALLDVHSDPDHHRSVLTYGGEPDLVIEMCFAMVERAVLEIDIAEHVGAHPRFGAVDILPFIGPVSEEEISRFAQRISHGLGIPTFMYGRAAPDTRSLPSLRRELKFDKPGGHATAGVVCIGLRDPLIAFNVNLDAPIADARRVARQIRSPDLRALAFELPSRQLVQVSMNLVQPLRLGPRAAYDRVAALTNRIVDAEVVGLVPQATLPDLAGIPLRVPARSIESVLSG